MTTSENPAQGKQSFAPHIIAFCCQHSAYLAADRAGSMRMSYPEGVHIVRVPCSGEVGVLHILRTFERGADGVLVLGCPEGSCHHLSGDTRANKRVAYARTILEEIGIEKERLAMFPLGPDKASQFVRIVDEMTERIRDLGPNPTTLSHPST